jgi:hypothetical protein
MHRCRLIAKTDTPSYRLQSERQLEQRSLSTSSQAYDRNLLSKIGGPNTPNRLSVSGGPETSGAVSPGAEPGTEHPATRHLPLSPSGAILRSTALPSGGLYRALHRPAHSALPTSIRRTPDQQHCDTRVFNSTTTHRIVEVMISPCS